MSTNCLVTKLKAVVNNPDLQVLGAMNIEFKAADSLSTGSEFMIHASENNKCVLSIVSGPAGAVFRKKTATDTYTNIGETLSVTTNLDVYSLPQGDYVLRVTNKYLLTMLYNMGNSVMKFNLDELRYTNNITRIAATPNRGDMADIADCPITTINLKGDNFSGELNSIPTTATSVRLIGTIVTGNLTALTDNVSISTLDLTDSLGVSGNIEALTSITALHELNLTRTNITGTLASLMNANKDALLNSDLASLYVAGTANLVKDSADITALRALGVNVVA